MGRVAARVEVFLLLFDEEVFLGFGWLLWGLGGYVRTSHTPCPSREGRFGRCFLIEKGGSGDEAASFPVGKMGWAEKINHYWGIVVYGTGKW